MKYMAFEQRAHIFPIYCTAGGGFCGQLNQKKNNFEIGKTLIFEHHSQHPSNLLGTVNTFHVENKIVNGLSVPKNVNVVRLTNYGPK